MYFVRVSFSAALEKKDSFLSFMVDPSVEVRRMERRRHGKGCPGAVVVRCVEEPGVFWFGAPGRCAGGERISVSFIHPRKMLVPHRVVLGSS